MTLIEWGDVLREESELIYLSIAHIKRKKEEKFYCEEFFVTERYIMS